MPEIFIFSDLSSSWDFLGNYMQYVMNFITSLSRQHDWLQCLTSKSHFWQSLKIAEVFSDYWLALWKSYIGLWWLVICSVSVNLHYSSCQDCQLSWIYSSDCWRVSNPMENNQMRENSKSYLIRVISSSLIKAVKSEISHYQGLCSDS